MLIIYIYIYVNYIWKKAKLINFEYKVNFSYESTKKNINNCQT